MSNIHGGLDDVGPAAVVLTEGDGAVNEMEMLLSFKNRASFLQSLVS